MDQRLPSALRAAAVAVAFCLVAQGLARAARQAESGQGGATIAGAERAMFGRRPSPWLAVLFRAPEWVYRLGLGWLFGHRMLLLTHRGRHSGRVYRTVLEVARYDPRTRESVVGSGWGVRADWYRNIQANPPLEVRTGRERYRPIFRVLAPEENWPIVDQYVRRLSPPLRPLAYRLGLDVRGTEEERRAHSGGLLFVAFRPGP